MATRRRFLFTLSALAGVTLAARARAQAPADRAALLRQITGGGTVQPGRVTFDTPELADNGHAVRVRIAVDSPMTATDHVRSITVIAERNPRPIIATFHLGPHSGRAQVVTRIRLADTQEVLALAQLSDSSYWLGGARVVVTELACVEGG
jgi:sulfur-oxidizing protein SoxY